MKNLFTLASLVFCLVTLITCQLYAADEKPTAAAKDEVVSEEIKPEAIRAEEGFCYTATLTLERLADCADENPEKKANQSECVLLEDGKPLSGVHSPHSDIRTIGKGKYSHWTKGTIYFSTSDNSDPRKNGRKYTLVSNKK
jgi:pectate lyase